MGKVFCEKKTCWHCKVKVKVDNAGICTIKSTQKEAVLISGTSCKDFKEEKAWK